MSETFAMTRSSADPEYGLEEAFWEMEDAAVDLNCYASRARVSRVYTHLLHYLSVQDCYCGEPPSIVKPSAGGCAPCQARARLEDPSEWEGEDDG